MAQLEKCFEVVIPLGLFTFWQVGWKSCGLGEIGDAFVNLKCSLHVFDTILVLQHSFVSQCLNLHGVPWRLFELLASLQCLVHRRVALSMRESPTAGYSSRVLGPR